MDGGDEAHLNASYSGDSGFKSRPGDSLFWLRFQTRSQNCEKATVSFVVYVRPRGSLTGRIFMKFDI